MVVQSDSFATLSLIDAAKLIRDRQLSPCELLHACFSRIDRWEPILQALVTRMDDFAEHAARQAETEIRHGTYRGVLHGIPVMVKDLIDVAGIPTTASSRILIDNIATRDATVVARLKAAGAIITAKTNTHEFAYGALTPPTRNPWDPARMPGGSSGGSAVAVASEMTFGALGTDTAGSVREPAALCGVVGLKPTFGRVSRAGVIPLAWSLDTVGPMARTVEDCASIFAAIQGPDSADLSSSILTGDGISKQLDIASLRVAVPSELMDLIQDDVRTAINNVISALSDAGARIEEVSIGDPDEIAAIIFVILGAEAAAYHRKWMAEKSELYTPGVLQYLSMGAAYKAIDYIDAQRLRTLISNRIERILKGADVILTPAEPIVAPPVDAMTVPFPGGIELPYQPILIRTLCPFSLSGSPAVTLPVGLSRDGLPIGVQLVGHAFQDEQLLGIASSVEALSSSSWSSRKRVLRPSDEAKLSDYGGLGTSSPHTPKNKSQSEFLQ